MQAEHPLCMLLGTHTFSTASNPLSTTHCSPGSLIPIQHLPFLPMPSLLVMHFLSLDTLLAPWCIPGHSASNWSFIPGLSASYWSFVTIVNTWHHPNQSTLPWLLGDIQANWHPPECCVALVTPCHPGYTVFCQPLNSPFTAWCTPHN